MAPDEICAVDSLGIVGVSSGFPIAVPFRCPGAMQPGLFGNYDVISVATWQSQQGSCESLFFPLYCRHSLLPLGLLCEEILRRRTAVQVGTTRWAVASSTPTTCSGRSTASPDASWRALRSQRVVQGCVSAINKKQLCVTAFFVVNSRPNPLSRSQSCWGDWSFAR